MQDRFKCRAWDKKRQKYIYNIQNGAEVYDYHSGHTDYLAYNELLEADSFIKEQCTGLKDKNGKMIYEGDIVETYDYTTENSQIVFDKGCYVLKSKDVAMYEHLSNYEKKCKIVGNVHDNSELLEK